MADALRTIVLRGAGLEAHVSPLGATLTKLFAPDRTGALAGASLRLLALFALPSAVDTRN